MTSTTTDTAGGEGVWPRRLRREIELTSLSRVADAIGVSRESLARYLARLDVHAGTRALIESRIAELDDATAALDAAVVWDGGPVRPSPDDDMEAADALPR